MTIAVLPALVFAPGAAAKPRAAGCAGDWDSQGEECSFLYGGGDVYVGMSLLGAPLGGGVVRLEKDGVLGQRETIISCAVGGMWSGCATVASSSEDFAPVDTPMFCVVEARGGSGTYNCGSNSSQTGTQNTKRVRRTRVARRRHR